ncbi:hypothetical protein ACFQX6_15050 [Streptosporangium lutulentum]
MNKLFLWGPSIRFEGVVRDPFPDAVEIPTHEADIADVAAVALLDDGHAGKAYIFAGPGPVTHREQVEAIDRLRKCSNHLPPVDGLITTIPPVTTGGSGCRSITTAWRAARPRAKRDRLWFARINRRIDGRPCCFVVLHQRDAVIFSRNSDQVTAVLSA